MDGALGTSMALHDPEGPHLNICSQPEAQMVARLELHVRLGSEGREAVDEDMTGEEIIMAIRHQKAVKTPGGDGLQAEFYHKHADVIADRILEVFQGRFGVAAFGTKCMKHR
ncbi:hypothetical protein NDU88_011575 [Pleurodeles waltl]|uniref:Uncharacterized protein n=1 Tax=Pleurodeles waltl TaxID=8319 RepID=A0AAV7S441_PLEWA|nr:hypothetical protein NDU88_011575 [Pleurodeles waltl]